MEVVACAASGRELRICTGLVWIYCCVIGAAQAGVSVYRCTDSDGRVELRQTYCPSGDQQQLRVDTSNLGWVRPTVPDSSNRKSGSNESAAERRSGSERSRVSDEAKQRRCWKVENKLERIKRRLRKGYRASEGDELRQRRREQEQYLRRFCRP